MSVATTNQNSAQPDICFKALNERYRKALVAFFRRRCRDDEDAEDLAQEVFLRLIALKSEQQIVNYDAYIFTVAANVARDKWRRDEARQSSRHMSLDVLLDESGDDLHFRVEVAEVLTDNESPELLASHEELQCAANSALAALPARTRTIFVLYRIERMKQKDIAALLSLSVSAVEKHLVRAMVLLAQRIQIP